MSDSRCALRQPWSTVFGACPLIALAALLACSERSPSSEAWAPDADARGHSAPTAQTIEANRRIARALPLDDRHDFENAERGRVAGEADVVVTDASGRRIWDTREYAFVAGEAPGSVNPSLWRQARLNGIHGLFEVVPGIHQVRGYDLSNLSIIQGETGWIVVDPLTSEETARAALALARQHLGERPIRAVLLTHSHIDHFGGIEAVLPEDPEQRAAVRIVAPADFVHEATSENVMAGVAMLRRAGLMYGMPLARSPRGHVDTGLGKAPARGTVGIEIPTDVIDETGSELTIDGVRFVFQYTPGSEAPAEFTFYLPEKKALCGAEVVSRNLHNVYTLRGAKVRDALLWSRYIDEMTTLFPEARVVFASHHWPTWGREEVRRYLEGQRDTYKFIHDQTLRMANRGFTPNEIAERLELPESLASSFANRGYYGTVRHDAKAVYQWYFGWYDGNPAHLDPLPPREAGLRYVELMGGAATVRAKARASFEAGEYRWAATLLDHLVFADPEDAEAREWLARSYDQLGYQAESGPWRDVYLTGAHELRHGIAESDSSLAGSLGLLRRVPLPLLFDSMAARVLGEEAEGEELRIDIVFTDRDEAYQLWLENAVLHHRPALEEPEGPEADATIRITHELFLRLALRQASIRELAFSDELDIEGSLGAIAGFFRLLEAPDPAFAIVTP